MDEKPDDQSCAAVSEPVKDSARGGGGPPASGSTAFLLAQVGGQASLRFGERVSALGISPPQVGLMFMLARSQGLSQRELADRLGLAPSRLVVLVDELEEAGLIERRADEDDRRTHAIHLTDAGREKLRAIGEASDQHNVKMLEALTETERVEFRRLLQKIADHEQLTPGVHPGYRRMGKPG